MSDGLTVSVRAEALLGMLRSGDRRVMSNLVRETQALSIEVQTAVKETKLTGQVLHVRSGTLRRSINRRVVQQPTSIYATVGTNVRYARPHEFGFSGSVTVRAHVRKVESRSQMSYVATRQSRRVTSIALKKTVQGVAFVREHVRQMNIPERSFLRSVLREKAATIRSRLTGAAMGGLRT